MRACRVLRHYRRWTAVVGQRIHISVRVQDDDDDLRRSRLSLLLLSPLPVCSALLPLLSKAPEATGRERARCRREQGRRNTQWPPPGRKGRSPLHTTRRRRGRRVRRTNRAHPREQRVRGGGARSGRKERVGEEGREDDLIGRATAMWRKNSSRAHRPTLLTMD